MKEIKDLNKWRDSPCSCIGSLNVVKMSILLKFTNMFNTSLIKIPAGVLIDIDKFIPMFGKAQAIE